jgi:imidazole glycerol phosphate synthase subunit HisF
VESFTCAFAHEKKTVKQKADKKSLISNGLNKITTVTITSSIYGKYCCIFFVTFRKNSSKSGVQRNFLEQQFKMWGFYKTVNDR